MRSSRTAAALLLPLLAAAGACTDLPQPFRNRPGAQAQRLATPLALRLAVPPPQGALLPDAAARGLAGQVAAALQAQEVPAVATDAPLPLDCDDGVPTCRTTADCPAGRYCSYGCCLVILL